MAVARWGQTETLLSDGRVLIVGGFNEASLGPAASAELYDPKAGSFSPTGSMALARADHTATLLSDGKVLIVGGWNDQKVPAAAELYDPGTGTFSPTGSLGVVRWGHTATLLSDGKVLIVGGDTSAGSIGYATVASAELYEPESGKFTATGSMANARQFQTSTPLADGRVLVSGGVQDSGPSLDKPGPVTYLRTAELYEPRTGTFSPTGSMSVARGRQTGTALSDGRVLITGGLSESGSPALASAEIYDPALGRFSSSGVMIAGRLSHTATALSDGRVVIAGGFGEDTSHVLALASAELFDPRTGTFSSTSSMTFARGRHTATALSDGRILVVGGQPSLSGVTLVSAELYQP